MTIVDRIFQLFDAVGETAYFGEPVSQREHALQSAYLAEQDGASATLVVAALLHDIGHLLHGLPEDIAEQGIDSRHEDAGEAWLARYFPRAVTEPVRLHVAAKRYLCTVDPGYRQQLSPASLQSLALQGGPLTPDEIREFEKHTYHREAVRLRRYDDRAKLAGLVVPHLEHYRSLLEAVTLKHEYPA